MPGSNLVGKIFERTTSHWSNAHREGFQKNRQVIKHFVDKGAGSLNVDKGLGRGGGPCVWIKKS